MPLADAILLAVAWVALGIYIKKPITTEEMYENRTSFPYLY